MIAPLKNRGLADVNEFTLNKIGDDQSLAIITGSGSSPQQIVFPADVQLSELLKPTGALGKAWAELPLLNANRPLFERWLVSQPAVTLSYDGAATLAARHEALRQNPQRDSRIPSQHSPRAVAAGHRR